MVLLSLLNLKDKAIVLTDGTHIHLCTCTYTTICSGAPAAMVFEYLDVVQRSYTRRADLIFGSSTKCIAMNVTAELHFLMCTGAKIVT